MVIKLIHHRLYAVNNNDVAIEEEEDEIFDEEEEIAKRQKMQIIARRPSAKNIARSSFKQKPSKDFIQNNILQKTEFDERTKKKVKKVCKYEKFKEIPIYIEGMMDKYCNDLKEIRLDYMRMNKEKSRSMKDYKGYKFCGDIFCLYKMEWFNFPIILQLFPNIECIEVYGRIELTQKILDYVLVILVTKINETIKENKDYEKEEAMKLLKLKWIKIDEPEQEILSITKAIKKYTNKFNKIGWRIYEDDRQLIMTSQEEDD